MNVLYCIALYCIILHCIVNKAKYHFKTVLSWQDIMVFLLYQIGKKYNRFRKKIAILIIIIRRKIITIIIIIIITKYS